MAENISNVMIRVDATLKSVIHRDGWMDLASGMDV